MKRLGTLGQVHPQHPVCLDCTSEGLPPNAVTSRDIQSVSQFHQNCEGHKKAQNTQHQDLHDLSGQNKSQAAGLSYRLSSRQSRRTKHVFVCAEAKNVVCCRFWYIKKHWNSYHRRKQLYYSFLYQFNYSIFDWSLEKSAEINHHIHKYTDCKPVRIWSNFSGSQFP